MVHQYESQEVIKKQFYFVTLSLLNVLGGKIFSIASLGRSYDFSHPS